MNLEIFSKKLLIFYAFISIYIAWIFVEPALKTGHVSFGGHSAGIVFIIIYGGYIIFATLLELISPHLFNLNQTQKKLNLTKNQLTIALLVGNIISLILSPLIWFSITTIILPFLIVILIKSSVIKFFSKCTLKEAIVAYTPIMIALFLIPYILIISVMLALTLIW